MSKEKKETSAVFNILAFNFDGEKTAEETVKAIKKSGALEGQAIVAEAIVSVNEKGKTHINEPGHEVMGGDGEAVGPAPVQGREEAVPGGHGVRPRSNRAASSTPAGISIPAESPRLSDPALMQAAPPSVPCNPGRCRARRTDEPP